MQSFVYNQNYVGVVFTFASANKILTCLFEQKEGFHYVYYKGTMPRFGFLE